MANDYSAQIKDLPSYAPIINDITYSGTPNINGQTYEASIIATTPMTASILPDTTYAATMENTDLHYGGGTGGVEDVTINGASIVINDIANLTTGFAQVPSIIPSATIATNDGISILAQNSDGLKKIGLNNLGYTRLKVTDSDDGTQIGVNDFLFVKGGN